VVLLGDGADVAGMLQLGLTNSHLQQAFAEPILAQGPGPLSEVMFTHSNNDLRRLAAGYLGTLGNRDRGAVAGIVDVYSYVPGLEQVPWSGGALYVPAIRWTKEPARQVVGSLIAWHVHCDRNGLNSEKQQIYNNLRSVGLHRPAGLPWPSDQTQTLLDQWADVVGRDAVRQLLVAQGAAGQYGYGAKVTK
jgi:hypothetical protein